MNSPVPIQPGGANLSAGKTEDHASNVVSKPFPLDEAKPAEGTESNGRGCWSQAHTVIICLVVRT